MVCINLIIMFLLTNFVNCVLLSAALNEINKVRSHDMKSGLFLKVFVYILSIFFLLLTNGLPRIAAESREEVYPIGEMISSGDVNFETRENVWKKVEPFHFPIFQGVKIKTGKGIAGIALANNCQIEVGQNSLFSFDQNNRLHLYQGQINFRISPMADLNFKVGNLVVAKSNSLGATKTSSQSSSRNGEIVGSISIHSNHSATIKSIQGQLSILDQGHTALATLSSQDLVTIPSITFKNPPKATLIKVGETAKGLPDSAKIWGSQTEAIPQDICE